LEGSKKRVVTDEKLFPELKGLDYYLEGIEEEQAKILKRRGEKWNKLPDIKIMAIDIDYQEEHSYFYKFSSKLLHFCPFTFNGDANFEAREHKIIFLPRIARYLSEIKKELDLICNKTKLKNL
jgi:hypothetical protein